MTPNNRFELTDIPTDLTDATQRQNFLSGINSALDHQEEQSSSAKSTGRTFAIGGSIIALLIATGLAFLIPGPQGSPGIQGEKGDVGPQGPAITNEALQLAVNTAVEAKLKDIPKPLTASQVRELIPPPTPAFNDSALKAETEALRKDLAEVRKELSEKPAEKPAEAVPTAPVRIGSSGTGWSEEIRETDDIKSNNLGWKVVGGYKFPMAKNKKGLPSPIFGDSEPTWIAAGDWKYLDFKLPNGAVVKAWALPR